jgi:acetylornithine deacetylase/succinyl-diaminopimelate desuccinylase-like protein
MTTRGSLAATRLTMRFHGRSAHAASNPHLGVNALDACIQTFNAVNALRQHVRDETRIHGIITHGGDAANIVPAYAEARFIVRHRNHDYVVELKERVMAARAAPPPRSARRSSSRRASPTPSARSTGRWPTASGPTSKPSASRSSIRPRWAASARPTSGT